MHRPPQFTFTQLMEETRKAFQEGWAVRIKVTGNSMQWFLHHLRDQVRLEAVTQESIQVNDVVLAEISPEVYILHRVIHKNGEHLTLQGDGNQNITELCLTSQVIGRVTAFYRKGRSKPDSVHGLKWKLYSVLWLSLHPVRKYILGLLRRLPVRSRAVPGQPLSGIHTPQSVYTGKNMKKNTDFTLRQICGENVILATGNHCLDFSHMISLNDSAAYLWESVSGLDFNVATLTDILCAQYEVDPETAKADAQAILDEWINYGLVQ